MKSHLRITIATLLEHDASQHEISRRTGVDRKTIRRYAKQIGANAPMATGSAEPAEQIPPPRPPAPAAGPTKAVRSACEPHRAWIEEQAGLGRNAVAIYQELVEQHGFAHRYNSVKRFRRLVRVAASRTAGARAKKASRRAQTASRTMPPPRKTGR